MRIHVLGCATFLLAAASLASAQNFATSPCPDRAGDHIGSWLNQGERACEIRRTTLPVGDGRLAVSGKNGGIEVVGEDRSDIALEVKVTAQGTSHEDADTLLHAIHILTAGGIRAEGPNGNDDGGHHGWSVDYRLHVPHRLVATDLRTTNGGINVADVQGDMNANTSNGGLNLHGLSGTVHAQTTNGGINISLTGNHWNGSGLFARSTNGGITMRLPGDFAAHLVADTTNGGVSVAFPVASSESRHDRHLETDINGGGAPVRIQTTNGGITVAKL